MEDFAPAVEELNSENGRSKPDDLANTPTTPEKRERNNVFWNSVFPTLAMALVAVIGTWILTSQQINAETERLHIQSNRDLDSLQRTVYSELIVAAKNLERAVENTLANFDHTLEWQNDPQLVQQLIHVTLQGYELVYQSFASANSKAALVTDTSAVESARYSMSEAHLGVLKKIDALRTGFSNGQNMRNLEISVEELKSFVHSNRGNLDNFVNAAKKDLGHGPK